LANGFNKDNDIGLMASYFETLSVFYISRSWGSVIVSSSTFKYNIGGFGGVFSINSLNFEIGTPYFIVKSCSFI